MSQAEPLAEALRHYRENRLALAQSHFEAILDQDPECAEAAYRLGLLAHRGGSAERALPYLLRAREGRHDDPLIHYTLGLVYHDLGHLDQAAGSFQAAIETQPGFAEAYNNLALVLQDQDRLDESLQSLRQALQIRPNYPSALNNMGVSLRRLNRLQEAAQAFEHALRLDPRYQAALQNLGRVWMTVGDASRAQACFSRVLAMAPGNAQANYYLGACLEALRRFSEALDCYRKAMTIQPGYVEAILKSADLLLQMNRTNDAIGLFRRVAEIRPGHPKALLGAALALPVIYRSGSHLSSSRRGYEKQLAALGDILAAPQGMSSSEFVQQIQWTNFFLAYQGEDDLELQARFGRLIANSLRQQLPSLCEQGCRTYSQRARIRIGFVSRFFRDCTVGHYFAAWITELDRAVFEINVYYVDAKEDVLTQRLKQAADRFSSWAGDVLDAARHIKSDELDILVYPELGMDVRAFVLAAMRLAPVQCAAWGHPVTTGLPTIDYFFSCARMEPPAAQDQYAERLLLIDGLGTHYSRPELPQPKSRDALGLPNERTLYLCPQSLFKILPDNDGLLTRAVKDDPAGTLVFFGMDHAEINRDFLARMENAFRDLGVAPAGRIIMLPFMTREDYLCVNMTCDLMLDCLHWSGGNTSLDAIACGLPIVSSWGRFMRGRQTAAMLAMIGVPELIARDADTYVQLAGELARNKPWRQEIAARMRKGSHRLFNQSEPIRELERHLRCLAEPHFGGRAERQDMVPA